LITEQNGEYFYEDRWHIGDNVLITYYGTVELREGQCFFREQGISIGIQSRLYLLWEAMHLPEIRLRELKDLLEKESSNEFKPSQKQKANTINADDRNRTNNA
jgi:hypothetical protein